MNSRPSRPAPRPCSRKRRTEHGGWPAWRTLRRPMLVSRPSLPLSDWPRILRFQSRSDRATLDFSLAARTRLYACPFAANGSRFRAGHPQGVRPRRPRMDPPRPERSGILERWEGAGVRAMRPLKAKTLGPETEVFLVELRGLFSNFSGLLSRYPRYSRGFQARDPLILSRFGSGPGANDFKEKRTPPQ